MGQRTHNSVIRQGRRMQATAIRALAAALLLPSFLPTRAPAGTMEGPGAAATDAALRDTLADAARGILGAGQGIYVEAADGSILLAQAADRAVHPASVSKVPTTLALLERLGTDYRFTTTFAGAGPVRDGLLAGDLRVDGGHDPYFVDENALLVARALNRAGVQRIAGRVRVNGGALFDWKPDADGSRLERALAGHVSGEALGNLQSLDPQLPPPTLRFAAPGPRAAEGTDPRPLVVHRSQPLVSLAKSLNDYSNNIFRPLADAAGGAGAVEALARSVLPASEREEVRLGDGAGTDRRNRLSPRAATHLLRALEARLARDGHSLPDILPVSGLDPGTLHARLDGPGERGCVVGKTGTYGDYGASALVGALRTTDHGTVYFAILNHGVPVPEARRRQDRMVREMIAQLRAVPWAYQRDPRPAIALAQVEVVGEAH
jgi:D-alanyl-D-alanine carboxypeptidase/D-alanyl-D-alanine-endopeptidase (penicillin-binding protein 4)